MANKENEPSNGLEKLFSTQGILIAILILGFYWVFFGEDKSQESARYNYSSQNIPIGVSNQLNVEAIEKLGIDLTEHLDPKLIPAITSEALRETSQSQVSDKDFLPTLVNKISNKVRDISTIDLNQDGMADHVLIVPQTEKGDEDFLLFSILVPDPSLIDTLPSSTDQTAWKDIAENKSIEIMTASVVRGKGDEMTMQSTPNPQMYQSAGAPYSPYYGTGYSMTNLLMTSMMMSMLFRPPYIWGGGYGYGYGGVRTVSSIQNRREASTSKMKKASPSSSSAKQPVGKVYQQTSSVQLQKNLSIISRAQNSAPPAGKLPEVVSAEAYHSENQLFQNADLCLGENSALVEVAVVVDLALEVLDGEGVEKFSAYPLKIAWK